MICDSAVPSEQWTQSGPVSAAEREMELGRGICPLYYLCSLLPTSWPSQPSALFSCSLPQFSILALTWPLVRQYSTGMTYKAWHFTRLSHFYSISVLEKVKILMLGCSSWDGNNSFFKCYSFVHLCLKLPKSIDPQVSYSDAYLFIDKGRALLQIGSRLLGVVRGYIVFSFLIFKRLFNLLLFVDLDRSFNIRSIEMGY